MANLSLRPIYTIRDDFEKLFSDVMPASVKRFWGMEPGVVGPSADILEKDDFITIKIALPGVSKDDIKIEVHENMFTIKGEHKREKEDKKEDYYRKEISCGAFYRSIELPANVEAGSANAVLKDGILEVTLKKASHSKPIQIEVK
jgi:HSP20 family protein